MKLLLFFFLLGLSDFSTLPASDANAKFSQNDLYVLREKSIIRGHYKDVASQFNGALLSSARTTWYWEQGADNSPLRNLLYHYPEPVKQGHVVAELGESMIVQFLQAYEINTVRFWMWDGDTRQTDIQVFTIAKDGQTEKIIFDGFAQPTIMVAKFSDQFASGLRFYNRGGNTLGSQYMSIIKIQAFYAF